MCDVGIFSGTGKDGVDVSVYGFLWGVYLPRLLKERRRLNDPTPLSIFLYGGFKVDCS